MGLPGRKLCINQNAARAVIGKGCVFAGNIMVVVLLKSAMVLFGFSEPLSVSKANMRLGLMEVAGVPD
jgi:hypothetical protein